MNTAGKEIIVSKDVNKIIDNALGQVRSILVEAVEQVNEDARAELIAKFNQAVGTGIITTVKAPRVSAKTAKVKTKAATKAKTKTAAKKPRRTVSEATRKKLAMNLKKARDAKAAKSKSPAKTKVRAKSKKK